MSEGDPFDPGDDTPFEPGLEPPEPAPASALWFVFRGRELLVCGGGGRVPDAGPEALGVTPLGVHYLGALGAIACYCAELPDTSAPPSGHEFRELRGLFGRLPSALHRVAGRAVQIVEWDRTHRYCGACATPTEPVAGERARACPRCGLASFPRLAPAIIVAVERGDEILLGRGPHFPPGIYSTIAGFVEPGESVEEAVRREVREETGVEVEDVRYFASQPWPYPHSLMLGFQARYRSGELRIDPAELEDAGWFSRDAMPMLFPGNVSIAQWLIHDFLRRGGR
jgi:NAD+ diphosphatase